MRRLGLPFVVLACLLALPTLASAQAFIVGVVRDTSGAVLPGVTVEAASPALIEKVRTVVTDGSGQYRVEDLRPGSYTVTFTLPGFSTVRREGIALTGTFTASVNAEMRVGALEETITVTGETPVVDVQSTTRQRVMDQEIIDAIPSGRNHTYLATLVPGVSPTNHDVGGNLGLGRQSGNVTLHGSDDTRTNVNGVSFHSANGSGYTGSPNIAAYQEMAIDTGGISAEQKEGGLRMNLIPRDGGNTFRGYFFGSFANDSLQGSNFSQELKDLGLGAPDSIKRMYDINPAYGGPIRRDKVWFHITTRHNAAASYVPIFFNRNAGNPNAWTYEPDTSRSPAASDTTWRDVNARLTWQATGKDKLAASFEIADECACARSGSVGATRAPENVLWEQFDPRRIIAGDWTRPMTNRLMLDAAFVKTDNYATRSPWGQRGLRESPVKLEAVTEQSTGLRYRAATGGQTTWNRTFYLRGAMSYITGTHAFKVGFNYGTGVQDQTQYSVDSPLSFRFNNGVPNRLTMDATPYRLETEVAADHGVFVQDKWTVRRMTLTLGLRYDYFRIHFPETLVGPAALAPNRNIVFPETDGVRWHELEPRSGVAFDLFGNGKTAVKLSMNRYLAAQAAQGTFAHEMAPAFRLVNTTNRSWNDANRNFRPDCDLLIPGANGECGALENPDFGSTRQGTAYDPDTLQGWGKRDYNWEFSAGVQQEVLPRVSVDVGYFRRAWGNFVVTDDRSISPADFEQYSITAPADPRLPGGGGYVISGLYDIRPAAFGRRADNYLTFADNYGEQSRHWNGVDVGITARPREGVLLSGGTSTGRASRNNCDVVTKLDNPSPLYCDQKEAFQTQVKFLGAYTIPRVNVLLSGTLQNMPGAPINANYVATTAEIAPSLGRNLAGGARNVTVNLVAPGTTYGERMNQIDVRIGKILTFGRMRTTTSLDIYNVLNSNAVLTLSDAFATWQRPQRILLARFAKVSVQVDF
jgi:hypothetical protein